MSNLQNKRQLVQLRPTNNAGGTFAYNNGNPMISFDIPAVPQVMEGGVYISGNFNVDTGIPDTAPATGDNLPANAQHTTQKRVWIDSRTGVNSAFDFVSIASLSTGQIYEQNKNYNRMCASLMPLSESFRNYISGGYDVYSGATSKNEQMGRKCDQSFPFCVKLESALLNGIDGIDLLMLGGLRITLNLAANSFVCRNNNWDDVADTSGTGAAPATAPASYNLKDLKLTYIADVPSPAEVEAMLQTKQAEWEYESFASFYQVVSSSDASISTNVNTGMTSAVICNLIPSKFLNNVNRNSNWAVQPLKADATGDLKFQTPVNSITWTAGGIRTPLDFETELKQQEDEGVATPQKNYEELNSLRDVSTMDSQVKDVRTSLSLNRSATEPAKYLTSVQMNDAKQVYNIGISYDKITEVGENLKNKNLGLRLQSGLTSGESHSLFMFVKHKNIISFNNGVANVQS